MRADPRLGARGVVLKRATSEMEWLGGKGVLKGEVMVAQVAELELV